MKGQKVSGMSITKKVLRKWLWKKVDVFCWSKFSMFVCLVTEGRSLVSKAINLFFRKLIQEDLLKSLILAPVFLFVLTLAAVHLM